MAFERADRGQVRLEHCHLRAQHAYQRLGNGTFVEEIDIGAGIAARIAAHQRG